MGVVTTVTVGSNTSSVYGLTSDAVADATGYFNTQLGAAADAWTAASSDNKKRSLVTAARWMDRALSWSGEKTSSAQALDWPRDGAYCDDEALADNIVPDDIARAEFELAGLLLTDPSQAGSSGTGSNVKRVQAGSASVEFWGATIGTGSDTRVPRPAWDLLKCYLSNASSSIGIPFVSGEGVESDFDDCSFQTGGLS